MLSVMVKVEELLRGAGPSTDQLDLKELVPRDWTAACLERGRVYGDGKAELPTKMRGTSQCTLTIKRHPL